MARASRRPSWSGQLRLALVSCPIDLTPALTSKEQIHFHKLNRDTGNRLRMQMIDVETEDVVSAADTVMGYEFDKGKYVTVEKDELDELKIESSEIINIDRVIPAKEVDWLLWDKPYLAEPADKGALDIFATIREALSHKEVVGVGRMVMARRERPVLVMPRGRGMMIVTLRDPDEIRNPEDIFEHDIKDVRVDKQNLSMATLLIDKMEGKIEPEMFEDRYDTALHDLVAAKMKGKKTVIAAPPERPSNVINLADALKASLKGGAKGAKGRAAPVRRVRASAHKRHVHVARKRA